MANKYQSTKTGRQIDRAVEIVEKLPAQIEAILKKILQENPTYKDLIPQRLSELLNDITDQSYNSKSENPQSGKAVAEAIANLLGSAPENLDTLEELAKALNEDENFAAKVVVELTKKVDKVDGKGLSTNDFTTALKNKLDGIEPNATALPKVINIYCENQLDERISKWDNKSLFNEYTDDGLYYFSFKYFNAYNINDEYSDGHEVSDDALLLVNTCEDGGPHVYQTLITYGKIYTNHFIDGSENVPPNWELMTVSQKGLDKAIGDVETSLENIIQKYGLGGDGV